MLCELATRYICQWWWDTKIIRMPRIWLGNIVYMALYCANCKLHFLTKFTNLILSLKRYTRDFISDSKKVARSFIWYVKKKRGKGKVFTALSLNVGTLLHTFPTKINNVMEVTRKKARKRDWPHGGGTKYCLIYCYRLRSPCFSMSSSCLSGTFLILLHVFRGFWLELLLVVLPWSRRVKE